MKRRLDKTHARRAALVRPIHQRLHELPPNAKILRVRIDTDGADAEDDRILIKAIASYDAAVAFGHHAIKTGSGEEHRKHARSGFRTGKIARKSMRAADRCKGGVTDLTARGGVVGGGPPNRNICLINGHATYRDRFRPARAIFIWYEYSAQHVSE